jgi:hypothetical protein
MMGAKLALLVLLGQMPAPGTSDLIARLGSGRYAEREAAAAALEHLGREALPVLRSARDDRDPEIRMRAAALIAKIEGALLTQPTLIRLDFDDQPLTEVVRTVGARAGIKLALIPENAPGLQVRKVTLREHEPVPFWKAIDRLCDAGHLQYNIGMHGQPGSREPVFPLYASGVRPAGPISDSGPFRVNLVSLHYQRDVVFVNPPQPINRIGLLPAPLPGPANPARPASTTNEQFHAQVQVAAEPRLALTPNGPLRITEAVDDRGQSLLIAAGSEAVTPRYAGGYFGLTAGSTMQMQAPLKHPEVPGKVIRQLRGVIPVMVATRKPSPLVAPLSGTPGNKSFQNDEVSLDILDVRINPNPNVNQTSIDVSIRPRSGLPGAQAAPLALHGEFPIQRPDLHHQQIEVVDAQGRPIPWYHSSFDAEGARITLTLTPTGQGTPAEVRYYGLARAATEIAFEFTDVPMP